MDKKNFSRRQFLKRGLTLTGSGVALSAAGTASAAGTNSIVTENQNQGTSQNTWDLSGEGQYSGFGLGNGQTPLAGVTDFIEGFADNMSVNRGQTINFKINTNSTSYRIDIYRLGYYAGNGARLMKSISMSSASLQPTPLTNLTIGLVDAGNWSVTASWAVPTTAVSGVYIAHLVRTDKAGENHITFVVRDDGNKHDIVFQTSDPTWQAYNGWGGFNLYGGSGLAPTSNGRAYKVSYNRPFATRDEIGTVSGSQDFVFGAEVCAIRWLEANGYDVCYIAGVDTDRNGSQLLNYKVFLSLGHDEYWSGGQRANVEAARAAGVNLAFLSGNEVFWKTRWEPSTDPSATAYRTLVCYKETRDGKQIDPLDPPTWTGSWRDPRFSPPADGGRPENALTGQFWTVDSWRSDTLTIPYPMTLLRFWRNTSVAKTTAGKTASLVTNLLGYEWDESPDNGFRPAGLIHLSSTTLQASKNDGDDGLINTYLLDYGVNVGAYAATHSLSLYRYPGSGALVFGAGTAFWVWGLDSDHDTGLDNTTPTDPNVQQATLNLLADMGVQPLTIQAGLVAATMSTDVTPPHSTINALGTLTQQQTVAITGTATDTGGLVAGVEVSTDGGVTWHPASGTTTWTYSWWPQAPGTYKILSRAIDDSVNVEVPGPGISVTVIPGATLSLFNPSATSPYGGANAPALVGPVNDTGAVELGIKFQTAASGTVTGIRFYKNPWNTGTHVGNLWSNTGTLLGSVTFTNETASGWQSASLASPVTLAPGTTYIVSYHSPAGNYSADPNYFTTTRTSGPLQAPANGGNSVFAYGTGNSVFPTNSGGLDNYWVDVVFARTGGAGNQPPTAGNNSGLIATANTPLSIPAAVLLANDFDPNGYPLSISGVSNPTNGTVSYNAATQMVTFTPTTGYPAPNYVGSATFNYTISNGNGGTATGLVTLTVSVPTSSLFAANSTPGTITSNDPSSAELGVKFQTTSPGKVIGVRFYKGPQNTGAHIGNLWTSSGALLATVNFTSETASGWQQANFSAPVTLATGTTYVVSYHTSGFYSADGNYFANALTSGPLTALSSASSNGNGVYAYGSTSVFPTNNYNAANYWVDVAFAAAGALGNQPPTANNDSGFITAENTALAIPASSLLVNDTDPNGFVLSITGVSSPSNGTVTYDAIGQVVNFAPTANYMGPAGFTYSITNGNGGTASASVSLTVTAPTLSLFSASSSPGTVTVNDASSVELGVKFQSSVAGKIVGVRFYKGPQNIGTHIGNLWLVGGGLLATANFTNETASGWQQVFFATPVTITPGTTYVASYFTTSGFYSADGNYYANALTTGPLSALSSSASGGNGVYAYGSASSFPLNNYNAANYWVDVLFTQGS
jgi:hypothetical protein